MDTRESSGTVEMTVGGTSRNPFSLVLGAMSAGDPAEAISRNAPQHWFLRKNLPRNLPESVF
jgi:uncharacterized Zn finger protein